MPLAATSASRRVAASVLEVEQVLAELLLGDLIGGLVEVGGEPPDGLEVSLLSSLSEAGELEILLHALVKQSGHERSLSKRGEEEPNRLETTLRSSARHARIRKMHGDYTLD